MMSPLGFSSKYITKFEAPSGSPRAAAPTHGENRGSSAPRERQRNQILRLASTSGSANIRRTTMLIFSAVGLAVGGNSAKANIALRYDFSMHHLRAAAQAAHEAHEVERSNPPEHGEWFHDMLRLVPVSVTMAGAALEANANEIVQDLLDGITKIAGHEITEDQRQRLEGLKDARLGNSTDRYRELASLVGKQVTTGNAVWEQAGYLVEFRNVFMHFKPAWSHEEDVHDSPLVKALKSRVTVAPGYRDHGGNKFQFPYGFMTYGCARWSVQTVLDFSKSYAAISGVRDRFADSPNDYALP
jgi:hypothetical protein